MIYAYLRISTNQTKQAHSYIVQERAIREKFKVDSVIKESVSGSAEFHKRKALLAMIESLRAGDKVVIYRMDRISRDIVKAGWIKTEIAKRGAELISLETPHRDHTTELIESILLLVAQYEKQVIRFRIQQTLDSKKARGEALGGKFAPFGYNFEIRDGKKFLKPNLREQEAIKTIKRFKTKSTAELLRILRAKGIKGKEGKELTYIQLVRILERIKAGRA